MSRRPHSQTAGPGLPLALGVALLLAVPAAAPAAHPHYEGLLREGIFALERGEIEEAVADLRLACFGLLDEPEALAGCLAYLGMAQAASGDDPGFRDTFHRLAQVEARFGAYAAAEIPPAVRAAFETELRTRIPPAMLEATPALARLAGPPAPATAPGVPAEPIAAPAAEPAPAPASLLPEEERALLDRARELMAAARTRQELDDPYRIARDVADAYPTSRTAQYLAAEIAYRAARWSEAVSYFRRGGDPADGNPMLLFYLAVSLYESGEHEAAADALRRSLPRIEQTPFVRSYRARILDEKAAPPASEGRR
jgi:tetratricopeptide (TPR) repeat protein